MSQTPLEADLAWLREVQRVTLDGVMKNASMISSWLVVGNVVGFATTLNAIIANPALPLNPLPLAWAFFVGTALAFGGMIVSFNTGRRTTELLTAQGNLTRQRVEAEHSGEIVQDEPRQMASIEIGMMQVRDGGRTINRMMLASSGVFGTALFYVLVVLTCAAP